MERVQGNSAKRIWGWYFFDWASQPYNTLLLTFIFAPYIKEVIGDGAKAQSLWGLTVGIGGILIAMFSPILGAIADTSGQRMRFIWLFSGMYVIGSAGLWLAAPEAMNLGLVLPLFVIGLVGMEFATTFTNAMLPDLAPREKIGRMSGNGWAFGYVGGLLALAIMLVLLADNATTGKTFVGLDPILGLDASQREGTRAVGPLTAIWYIVFMIPFFLFVRDPKGAKVSAGAVRHALSDLARTVRQLPQHKGLFAYLTSSMIYRDGLNGMYAFGGVYAAGVLGWGVQDTGVFGLIAIISGALFAWLGGMADEWRGPRPVIIASILALLVAAIMCVLVTPTYVLGFAVPEGSKLPDMTFYLIGAIIGAAGGTLQASSRTMLVHQANPERMTEAFGLYALAGKATSFIAPFSIGLVTHLSGSQQIGVTPLIVLFAVGLFLLRFVPKNGDNTAWAENTH
ncbi:MFS transporter [Donghicola tyrosinivorans]|uniref:UMF1 family MFS transporter n=1 Tax=Donghicola tyrosinivorans TaxID=1652492 RepID=A0A2T0WXS1_9RHOB|nr:MFS transporter [Donghicola tyrosinivorans]PRY91461.1 UMF1 family MFS transporter [Donghicola tyrosinivorans]